jgi:hypothetical protein
METFLKEKEVVYDEGGHRGGNVRGRADAGLALGIVGTVLGGAALLGRGGIGAILGGGGSTPVTVNTTTGGGCSSFNAYAKECDDVIALTNTIYGLKIGTMQAAQMARDVDVAEKFGLYKDNRDNIDAVNSRINNELFSLYKYTRDKDDETNAKINEIASAVAVNSAVRPYQDKLIQCELEKNFTWLKNYVDRKTCRMIEGVNTLPLTPTVTGVIGQNCGCYQFPAAAAAAATEPAAGA